MGQEMTSAELKAAILEAWDQDYADEVADRCLAEGQAMKGMCCTHLGDGWYPRVGKPCRDGDKDITDGQRWRGEMLPLRRWRKRVLEILEDVK